MSFRFSIIIPTYNRAALLAKALESVQQLRVPAGCRAEVLVVDNNCTDDTGEVARRSDREGPLPVRRVVEQRQGLNHGRNRGLAEAAYEHLVYLDDDMTVVPGWLEGYVEAHETLAPDSVVGPVDPVFEIPVPEWMTRRMLESVTSAYSQKGDALMLVPAELAHQLPGCNFSVRSQVAHEVGGFHPSLDRCGGGMLAGGDWEFGERLVRSGRSVAYSPRCRIDHLVSAHKLSRRGLRERWEGQGATARALMQLRGERLPPPRRLRLYLRMIRFAQRWLKSRIKGDRQGAFQWQLEALQLRGLLLGSQSRRANS